MCVRYSKRLIRIPSFLHFVSPTLANQTHLLVINSFPLPNIQEPKFFESWGRVVALLDYNLHFTKVIGDDNCVLTPKNVTQCIDFK